MKKMALLHVDMSISDIDISDVRDVESCAEAPFVGALPDDVDLALYLEAVGAAGKEYGATLPEVRDCDFRDLKFALDFSSGVVESSIKGIATVEFNMADSKQKLVCVKIPVKVPDTVVDCVLGKFFSLV